LVSILFAIVPDYGNEYTTKENKNWTSFKNFALKLNLNHNLLYNPAFDLKIAAPHCFAWTAAQSLMAHTVGVHFWIFFIHFTYTSSNFVITVFISNVHERKFVPN